MRVALFQPFPDPWRQSMRIYAGQLQRHLDVLAGSDDTVVPVSLEQARLAPPGRYWDQYVRYQRLARRTRADVHHILDHGYAHLTSALPPRRSVVTFHDAIPVRSGRASAGTRLTLGAGMRRAVAAGARFITGSQASRRDAEEFYDVDPAAIDIVPYGVDERFHPAADREALRARLGLTRTTVLIVGHTQPYMNVEGALAATGRAALAIELDVVKIGAPLTVEHRALARQAGLEGRLRERGIVSDEDIRDWYAAADALIYLPRLSGYGLPVLEAMASGTPVVASSTGAVPEVAGDAATLVDPDNAEAAGDALAEILTRIDMRHARIESGLAHAVAFTWQRAAELTMQVYRKVADGA